MYLSIYIFTLFIMDRLKAAWIQSSENDVDQLYFSTALASNSNTLANDLLRHVTITITQYL